MTDTIATPANGGTAAPAVTTDPVVEPVTSAAPPDEGTPASPDSEAQRLKRAQETRERIEELNARSKAALEYGEFWRRQFEESQRQAPPAAAAPAAPQPDPEPQADQFEDVTAFVKAHAAWARKETLAQATREAQNVARQEREAAEKAIHKAREEERLGTLDAGFASRSAAFEADAPDYRVAISNPALTFFNGEFLEVIKGHELGPQIAYHIAKTPQLVAKLASQSVPQRLATLGRIEADLTRPAPPPKVTTAPTPPTPVGGGSGGEPDPSKMTTAEWMSWRTKQKMAQRRAR